MEILQFIGLAPRAGQLAAALPYGELRLLEVAIALAAKPRLLLLDEPVCGLNPAETANFMALKLAYWCLRCCGIADRSVQR